MRGLQALGKYAFEGMGTSSSSQIIPALVASLPEVDPRLVTGHPITIRDQTRWSAKKLKQEKTVPLLHGQTGQDLRRDYRFLYGSWGTSGIFS